MRAGDCHLRSPRQDGGQAAKGSKFSHGAECHSNRSFIFYSITICKFRLKKKPTTLIFQIHCLKSPPTESDGPWASGQFPTKNLPQDRKNFVFLGMLNQRTYTAGY